MFTLWRYSVPVLRRSTQLRAISYAKFRPIKNNMSIKPLNFDAGPLVWIDCEMTGLNPQKDKILEIAVRVERHSFCGSVSLFGRS